MRKYFILIYLFCFFYLRSERDVNSVEITHQEKKTKIDKVKNLHVFIAVIRCKMVSKN